MSLPTSCSCLGHAAWCSLLNALTYRQLVHETVLHTRAGHSNLAKCNKRIKGSALQGYKALSPAEQDAIQQRLTVFKDRGHLLARDLRQLQEKHSSVESEYVACRMERDDLKAEVCIFFLLRAALCTCVEQDFCRTSLRCAYNLCKRYCKPLAVFCSALHFTVLVCQWLCPATKS